MDKSGPLYDSFLVEYGSEQAVRKYTTRTSGYGISHLLRHDYARIYADAVDTYFRGREVRPLRLLEFGCGGGMNITRLVGMLDKRRNPVECAIGTDFSPRLVHAAKEEADTYLPARLAKNVSFYVARNEELESDLLNHFGGDRNQLGSFDIIIGVNTFRYCHRLGTQGQCAKAVYRLLRPGGICINIDMNDRFPAFRSRLRGSSQNTEECYIPSLAEYAAPFEDAGFQVIRKGHFCWIPHSAGPALTTACRVAAPFLNLMASSRAMRSLVIARRSA